MIKRIIFILVFFVLGFCLSFMEINPVLLFFLTFIIIMILYVFIAILRNNSRLRLLNEECDPEAFLERVKKQEKLTGKNPKSAVYLSIDIAAGLITLGEFQKAKELLTDIDITRIIRNNSVYLIYTINLMICCYELGEIEQAEKLFETNMAVLSPVNKSLHRSVKMLMASRYYYLGRFEESYESFNKLLEDKFNLSKRYYLTIIYFLALMEERVGNSKAAYDNYRKVAAKGNKLYIASSAKDKLNNLIQN